MKDIRAGQTVVREGTCLYDNSVECDIWIVHSPIQRGSSDYEDPPEIAEDIERDTFYIIYGPTTERGKSGSGGGGYRSIEEAVEHAQSDPGIGKTIRWKAPAP
jgi:hypothetical protein